MTWDKESPTIGRIFSDEFVRTFGPARTSGTELTDRERDIAASLQLRLEEVAYHLLNHVHERTGLTDLGLAGGVAYNSVMNGKILLHTPFRRILYNLLQGTVERHWVFVIRSANGLQQRRREVMEGAYTGPEFLPLKSRTRRE
jgi:carbamoyltransferase